MNSISFDNPWYLLIAVPLVALFTVPFIVAIRKTNVNGHNIASQVLHVLIAVIIAFAAAGTSFDTVLTETNVYVVADVSYSANKNLDAIDNYIKNLDLPANSKLGVVCFGKDCEILCNMGKPDKFKTVKNSTVDDSETNICDALEFTGGLFKDDVIKRIVLITDGKATDTSDDYAMARAVEGLEAQGVRVDAIYLNDNISADAQEVQIASAQYTESAFFNRSEKAAVSVRSTYDTRAVMTLKCDGDIETQRAVELKKGINYIDFDLDTSEEGEKDYEVTVEADGDGCDYNNVYKFTQKVTSVMKVMVVTGDHAEGLSVLDYYGDDVAIDIYDFSSTADKTPIDSEKYPNANLIYSDYTKNTLPYSIGSLCQYDEFVISEIVLGKINTGSSFATNLSVAVSEFGKTLLTFGNIHTENTSLGSMLPVNFGNDDSTPKLYTLIIDSSRSMEDLNHLKVAKQLAVRLVNTLTDKDEICLITFNGTARMIQPPTPLNKGTRSAVTANINALDYTQGTVIGAGLKMCYDFVNGLEYSSKQVMLITDGLDYLSSSAPEPRTLARTMRSAGIITSVFDVGRQGDTSTGANTNPTNAMARSLLMGIAAAGGGKYFYSNNAASLGDITFGDIQDFVTETINEKQAEITVLRRVDNTLAGLESVAIPSVNGYIYTRIKPAATTVLAINHVTDEEAEPTRIPLYAYWEYGSGKVASFTSRVGNGWLDGWKEAGVESVFMSNVVKDIFPKEKVDKPYLTSVERDGAQFEVSATPGTRVTNAEVSAHIFTPDGDSFFKLMNYNNTDNKYVCRFDGVGAGSYRIEINYNVGRDRYISEEVYHYSYSDEYDSFAIFNPAPLYKALNGKGEVSLDGKLSLKNEDESVALHKVNLTVPLLIAAVALYVVDIAVRKLKWDDIKSFFGLFRKSDKKSAGGKAV